MRDARFSFSAVLPAGLEWVLSQGRIWFLLALAAGGFSMYLLYPGSHPLSRNGKTWMTEGERLLSIGICLGGSGLFLYQGWRNRREERSGK
jgi:hypothetical protein